MFKVRFLYILILLVMVFSYFKKSQLGEKIEVVEDLYRAPIQFNGIPQERFSFNYFGNNYEIEKKADYEISGLVVSHNNISGWGDIYHDETSLDTKDLCVIWGDNLKTEDYKKVTYSSGSWTCYFQYDRSVKFNKQQLSNNHLITNDSSIRDIINKVSVGDQIKIKGHLVNYRDVKWDSWRQTSMTRQDTGNQACEVIFVKSIVVLKSANAKWRDLFELSKKSILVLLLLQIIYIFFIRKVISN